MFPHNLAVYAASQSHCLAVLVEFKIEITSFLTASIMNRLTVVKFCEGRRVLLNPERDSEMHLLTFTGFGIAFQTLCHKR